ncbi:hypothetical protein [Pectobacterium aroidearum]|uniref:hypothetical protein n=1 Tax=Pectobacterium aroidearum TaxID=1201031 RepID=UPI0032F03513
MAKFQDNTLINEANNVATTLEWCRSMMEILIEKESNGDIGNAMTGVLSLIVKSQDHAENIIKNINA